MAQYSINGGRPLHGTIEARGNKNAALPCLAASLLTGDPVILENVPAINDVIVMLSILQSLGGEVEQLGRHSYRIHTKVVNTSIIPPKLASKIRASILFVAPLLARTGEVYIAPPGGDVIGKRRLDSHIMAFTELGASFYIDDNYLHFRTSKLKGQEFQLDEASVTATENAVMAGVLAEGTTVLENAACEPHVQDLCHMLNQMGAKITGIGSNVLVIEGVERLVGTRFILGSDFMEVGSFIGLAAITNSELMVKNVQAKYLKAMRVAFRKLGVIFHIQGDSLLVPEQQDKEIYLDIDGGIPKIEDAPWPGFPADLMSIMLVVATQVKGTILIHEKLFESRMFFVDRLISMGAHIILCDPHRAVVSGATTLSPIKASSPDVRAGMAMLLAALCAKGQSTISNIYQIERGYEDISLRLQHIGAQIHRVEEDS